jgi:stage III sporulation protein AA
MMATVIRTRSGDTSPARTSAVEERLRELLPSSLWLEIESFLSAYGRSAVIEEIRLRSGRNAYVTLGDERENLVMTTVTDSQTLSSILERICDGSLYAYSESLIKGYVSAGCGIRVGVCGRAPVEGGRILGIYDISALNIRLPCGTVKVGQELLVAVRQSIAHGEGVLVYSPPAQGKTTLLRSLAYCLASGENPLRVSLIDTRDELWPCGTGGELSIDLLSGYPKAEGIRIATAFMNPQVIICDEIGSTEEAEAIAEAQNSGVPLIASAHGTSPRGLLQRRGMKKLFDVRAFGLYVGVFMGADKNFRYRIQSAREVELENSGSDAYLP